jgi:hypothetical protein
MARNGKSADPDGKSTLPPLRQEVGYYARPFVYSCLPVRKPHDSDREWVHSRILARFRVVPDPKFGVPYGQDRMIFLLLASYALEQKQRRITLGSASDILKWMGLPPDGQNYKRLKERLSRVLGSTIFCTYYERRDGKLVVMRESAIYYQDLRLWFQQPRRGRRSGEHFENSLTVSEGFRDELGRNPGQVDLQVVRALAGSPANLAFYLWLATRSQEVWPDHFCKVPLSGRLGLGELLGVTVYWQQRDFRRNVRRWLGRIRRLWNECPADLSEDGNHLIVRHAPHLARLERAG